MRDRLGFVTSGTPAERFAMGEITPRRARLALVAMHAPFVMFLGFQVAFGLDDGRPGRPLAGLTLLVAVLVIQLRHSLAALEGRRPAWWPVTFTLLLVLVYVPTPAWTYNWSTAQWFVIASAAMLLPRRLAVLGVAGPILGTAVADVVYTAGAVEPSFSIVQLMWLFAYTVSVFALGGIGLYVATRVVRTMVELDATRTTLAAMATTRERLRMARDLHDVLGHSLSAVSLKGDLALRLLEVDRPQARAEVEDLTELARTALRDVRAVALDERDVTMARELSGAAALLGAAGIEPRIEVVVDGLDPRVDALLGWTIREGITNVLRHSDATTCSITASVDEPLVRVDIVNDGVAGPPGDGTGLDGLRERAAAVGATCAAGPDGAGRFHLRVVAERWPA